MTPKELVERTQLFLTDRKKAYQAIFSKQEVAGRIVLEDLVKFCRAAESCVVPGDHDRSLVLEGRREVWLRIQQHLKLSSDQLYELYTGNKSNG